MMLPGAKDVLDFWLDEIGEKGWFGGGDELDGMVRDRFLPAWEAAMEGRLGLWLTTPREALAYVILLDQFPRNMFRGESRSYVTDKKAQETAEYAVDHAVDRELPEFQRMFLYMPLMHSENLSHQRRSVELFRGLGEGDAESYAVRHMEIVERFGRFPHRNDVLGRPTTAEEAEFLKEPGSSF
jgi:uncharacterized protein (DUF924 family)